MRNSIVLSRGKIFEVTRILRLSYEIGDTGNRVTRTEIRNNVI